MSLPLEFIVDGTPVSQQTRNRARLHWWIEHVRDVARQYWPTGESAVSGLVMVTILYFYLGTPMDVDNMPKPIIDALKELVIRDDDQVTDLICRKRLLGDDFRAGSRSSILSRGFRLRRQFVYVAVEDAPNQEVIE